MADNKWEDVPEEEWETVSQSNEGWEDVPMEVTSEEPKDSFSLPEELTSPAIGATVGTGLGEGARQIAKKTLPAIGEGMQSHAARQALMSIGLGDSTQGKKFVKRTLPQEMIEKMTGETGGSSLFTPEDVGRKVLQEDIWTPEQLFEQSKKQREELQSLLSQVEGKATAEEMQSRIKKGLEEYYPFEETKPYNYEKTLSDLEKKYEGLPARNVQELEKIKQTKARDIDYGAEKPTQDLSKIEAKSYKEASEDLVREFGGEELLDKFKGSKTEAGKLGIIEDILTDANIKDYARKNNISLGDAISIHFSPWLYAARKGMESSKVRKGYAKVVDKMGQIAKQAGEKSLKSLPIVGGALGLGLGYSTARAEGLEPSEAIGRAIEEEGIEAIPVIGPALVPETSGPERGSEQFKVETGEKPLGAEDQQEVSPARQRGLETEKKYKYDPIAERQRLENFLNEFQSLSNPSAQRYSQDVQKLISSEDENEKARIKYSLEQQPGFKRLLERANKKVE